jgi:hypothetical protein
MFSQKIKLRWLKIQASHVGVFAFRTKTIFRNMEENKLIVQIADIPLFSQSEIVSCATLVGTANISNADDSGICNLSCLGFGITTPDDVHLYQRSKQDYCRNCGSSGCSQCAIFGSVEGLRAYTRRGPKVLVERLYKCKALMSGREVMELVESNSIRDEHVTYIEDEWFIHCGNVHVKCYHQLALND